MGPRGASTGGLGRKKWSGGAGFERWEFWWENNKDPFLNLKNRLSGTSNQSGTGGFLTGRGRKDTFNNSKRPTADMLKNEVLPVLLEAMKIDNADIQDSTVLAVSRITRAEDADQVMDNIISMLGSNHKTAREAATLSLGVLGSPKAIQLCNDLMIDSDAGQRLVNRSEVPKLVRAFAALSLGLIKSGETWTRLKTVIEREDEKTQKNLIGCAITALGLMGETDQKDEIVQFLIKQMDNTKMDPFLMAYVPTALGKLGDRVALSRILTEFKKPKINQWIAQSCAIAIGSLADISRDEEAINLLMKYVKEGKDVQARHFSFTALAQIGARDENYETNQKLHKKISDFFLAEIVRPSRPSHLSWACMSAAIHSMNHNPLQAAVVNKISEKFSDAKDPSHKGAISVSLGLLNAVAHAQMLFDELNDSKDKALQGYLCIGLGLMNWTTGAERMRDIAATEITFRLRLQAATALGLMGDTDAVKVLVEALQNSKTLGVTSSAAKALGQIGDRSALAPLTGIVNDGGANSLSRAFAAVALGIIGEKNDLPWNTEISTNCNYRAKVDAISEVLDIL